MQKKDTQGFDVAVVGSGIVGLAMAFTAANRGKKVIVFERNPQPIGASIRNFGLIWPVGQGLATVERALRSREIWLDLQQKIGFWAAPIGSLQLAYAADEMEVIEEFFERNRLVGGPYRLELLNPKKVAELSSVVKTDGLRGGLFSKTEINIDPRQALFLLKKYLETRLEVTFFNQTAITEISAPSLFSGWREWQAEQIFVCSGADFETLFPEIFTQAGITKCKLQMLRTAPQPSGWQLGPSLAAGLTLAHYDSFSTCFSLEKLKKRFQTEFPEFVKWGIHVLVSQTAAREITLGDSHEYGLDLAPFDRSEINALILKYLHTFAHLPDLSIAETWHGIYPKMKNGKTEFVHSPESGVTIVNGLGGAGMTMSFGLAEAVFDSKKP